MGGGNKDTLAFSSEDQPQQGRWRSTSEDSGSAPVPSQLVPNLLSALPDNVLATHIAPFATTKELGRFCRASSEVGRLESQFARMVAQIQHGIFMAADDGETSERSLKLSELCHTLDSVWDRALFEFTRPFMAALLKPDRRQGDPRRGPDFMLVDVGGGRTGYRTVAACPPGQGDCWRLLVPLRRGQYRLEVSGWRNPHHGILDISLDSEAISPTGGLDWYAEVSTATHTFPPMPFNVETTGTHVLRGETVRCNSKALGAKYWICLESIRIVPAGEELESDEVQEATGSSLLQRRQQALHRRPAPVLAAHAAAERVVRAAGAAVKLVGGGATLGKRAAWWATLQLVGSMHAAQRACVRCPCRRILRRGTGTKES